MRTAHLIDIVEGQRVCSVMEYLPSICKALSLIFSIQNRIAKFELLRKVWNTENCLN